MISSARNANWAQRTTYCWNEATEGNCTQVHTSSILHGPSFCCVMSCTLASLLLCYELHPGRCGPFKEKTPPTEGGVHPPIPDLISLLQTKCLNLFFLESSFQNTGTVKSQVAETFEEAFKLLKCKRIIFPSDIKRILNSYVGGSD